MSDPYAGNVATTAAAAANIVPRAEFRVFGQNLIAGVQAKMWDAGAVLQKARRMPAEIYLLSRHTDAANVKCRDGLLDIKLRTALTPEGYEVFQPSGKFQFPVGRRELAVILAHLQIEIALEADSYAFEDFLSIARRHPDLAVVKVEKMRYGFGVAGAICEYAQVWFNGALMETACCESEDRAAVGAAVQALGLAGMKNTSYVAAARRVVGLTF